MPDPRSYKRGTIFALAALGGGTCYWPDPPCPARVTVLVNGQPVPNLQIAHIRAARPNGPRYIEMSDDERRAWSNLILLCTSHHNFVDKIKPQDYPIEKLEEWKARRESGVLSQLKGLSELTEDRLETMIAVALQQATKEIKEVVERLKPIDPEAASLLYAASRSLNLDTADMLTVAANSLKPALDPDRVEMLWDAAALLASVLTAERVGTLYDAVEALQGIGIGDIAHEVSDLVNQLQSSVRQLRDYM